MKQTNRHLKDMKQIDNQLKEIKDETNLPSLERHETN